MKKKKLTPPYIGIEEYNGLTILYSNKGEYSVVMTVTNPIRRYSSDAESYYEFNNTIANLIKTLGEKYAIQKHDIFSKVPFHSPESPKGYLQERYFQHFEGRLYSRHQTFLTITQERSGGFLQFNASRWKEFLGKITKIQDILADTGWNPHVLAPKELEVFLHRYFCINFRDNVFSIENIKANDKCLSTSSRIIKSMSLINIDEIDMPNEIFPLCITPRNGSDYAEDLFSFIADFPDAEDVIYHQSIIIPNQKIQSTRLAKKRNRQASLPSASNGLAAEEIKAVEYDIAHNNKLYVYIHYNIITIGKKVDKALNYFEGMFSKKGIRLSQANYNQFELFLASLPGCAYWSNPEYDRFLTLHDVAGCLMYKEREEYDEDTPLKIYYTNRIGIPKAIDITGKEGSNRLTTNSNFFCLGPSGSGKSFHMNSVVRQLFEQDTDIVMVDTGHSYEGLCSYVNGKYITYREEAPISMNPFKISKEEYNIEKVNFLKSLIFVIWKGAGGKVTKVESELIQRVIQTYYRFYFEPFTHYSTSEYEQRKKMLQLEVRSQKKRTLLESAEKLKIQKRHDALKLLSETGEGGEKTNALILLDQLEEKYDFENSEINALIKREIASEEELLRDIKVNELSFNSFFEFAMEYIPFLVNENKIPFDINEFRFLMSRFYKGGAQERTLNEDMDTSLFDEKFIVFEIDSIKDDAQLFSIVTLIIMDVFLQKMRIKKNRKALIIEEAWKALASDLMAEYVQYLYKTVRKFWGIIGVVTQEVEDIISSKIVKNAIINNSEITILLDQTKLKDRFQEIKQLLGLTDTECAKIWTINNLPNKEGRFFFSEVYIRRGSYGEVYGVEESPQSYMAYTTERIEKDALMSYYKKTDDITKAIDLFCSDWAASGIKKAMDFAKSIQS